ncbi:MAG: hypothetical protein HYY68_05365 [Thaumarchaeota archaeon]|nr:hypothetical protein [Nitrososphaerota archaeon]
MYVSGTVEIQNPNYGLAEISDIVDRVRACIAKESGKPLHMVEKADLQTTALVAWHATRGDSVEFIFHDRALKQCLQSVFAGRFHTFLWLIRQI